MSARIRIFAASGNRLEVRVPVTLAEAALGAKIDVPTRTASGKPGTISLTVPPNTSSGKRLRIKGHGVRPANQPPGDLFAEIQIVLAGESDGRRAAAAGRDFEPLSAASAVGAAMVTAIKCGALELAQLACRGKSRRAGVGAARSAAAGGRRHGAAWRLRSSGCFWSCLRWSAGIGCGGLRATGRELRSDDDAKRPQQNEQLREALKPIVPEAKSDDTVQFRAVVERYKSRRIVGHRPTLLQ